MADVRVPVMGATYEVAVVDRLEGLGERVRPLTSSRRIALVSDTTVDALWGPAAVKALEGAGFAVARLAIPSGEEHKTISTWQSLVDALLRAGVDRGTPVVALGGGVLGDVAGFAAATVLRGLPLVQVPTTLLAMVDSSVGGKTGVNHPLGKNLVGAFHQPMLVYAALETLATLPRRELVAGMGEVLKTAAIRDASLFAQLTAEDVLTRPAGLGPIVHRCVALKAEVVALDEREAGIRAILNAGHTYGHALETAFGHGTLLHGEAVAIGLVAEARWAERLGVCPIGVAAELEACARGLSLPVAHGPVSKDVLLEALRVDKKTRGGKIKVPLPVRVGEYILHELPGEAVEEWVARL